MGLPHHYRAARFEESSSKAECHFVVSHDDGVDKPVLVVHETEEGWNPPGTYRFSADPARVELTDECPGGAVFADAVKWVRRR